jgi:hypothetical protein
LCSCVNYIEVCFCNKGKINFKDYSGKGTWYNGKIANWTAYGQSKTANILYAVELSRRMKAEGLDITANAVHPGIIKTELVRDLSKYLSCQQIFIARCTKINQIIQLFNFLIRVEELFFGIGAIFSKNIPQGAATAVFAATSPQLEGITGRYLEDSNLSDSVKKYATNPEIAKNLWEFTDKLIAEAPRPNNEQPKDEQPKDEDEASDVVHSTIRIERG